MNNIIRSIGVLAGGMILINVTVVSGEDWAQWRGPNRDGKVAGFTAPQTWPKELTQKWKVTVGTGDATPALVGDKLYVVARQGENEVILCLNAANGQELWQDKYSAKAVAGPGARHPGPRGSPAVADGKVVTLGAAGVLSCLDAATAKVLWRKDEFSGAVPQFFTGMSPIIVDGMAVAHLGGSANGAIVALDLTTGAEKWKWTGEGPAYGSPVVLTAAGVKQLVAQTEKSLVAVAVADGKLLWQVATPVQDRHYNSATPIVDGQTVIYTGQGRGTRAVTIEKKGDAFAAKELWVNADLGTGYNTPVLKDGLLFGLSDKGHLYCMNAKTGVIAWTDTIKRETFGSILDAGSVLLALIEKSGLIAFKPGDKQYEELARFKVSDTPVYAHPVVAGSRIFVKDAEKLTMFAVE